MEHAVCAKVQFGVLGSWRRGRVTLDLRTGELTACGRRLQVRGADVTYSRRGASIVTPSAHRRPQLLTLIPAAPQTRATWRAFARALSLAALSPPGYRVLRALGRGGSGRVYAAAVDDARSPARTSDDVVALKLVPRSLPDDCAAEIRMAEEAPHSPRVVRPLRVFYSRAHLVVVMRLVAGGSLLDLAEADNDLPHRDLRRLARQLLEAVRDLHDVGVAHRDVKLENALLDARTRDLVLCDLGLASRVPRTGFSRAVGTVYTQAPEVGATATRYGTAVDMWSVGVVVLILFARTVPFTKDNRLKMMARMRARIDAGEDPLSCLISPRRLASSPPLLLDLLRGLLTLDPRHRLNVHEALAHKWFRAEDEADAPVTFAVIADVKVRLRKFVEQFRERSHSEEMERDCEMDVPPPSLGSIVDIKCRIRRLVKQQRELASSSSSSSDGGKAAAGVAPISLAALAQLKLRVRRVVMQFRQRKHSSEDRALTVAPLGVARVLSARDALRSRSTANKRRFMAVVNVVRIVQNLNDAVDSVQSSCSVDTTSVKAPPREPRGIMRFLEPLFRRCFDPSSSRLPKRSNVRCLPSPKMCMPMHQ